MQRANTKGADSSGNNSLVLANLNTPWSAFVCGSQGAGKSHTLSCLLESSLVSDNGAGELPHPLAGLVMHYDSYTSYSTTQYCEAAYLYSSGIPVTVLVCPSNIWAMSHLYKNLPGLKQGAPRPKVVPLYLFEDKLNISRMLKLMAVDKSSGSTPMYMEVVLGIIREMAMEGRPFTYSTFLQRLNQVVWAPGQKVPLELRLQMLDSFLVPSEITKSTRPAQAAESIWSFEPGTMTIVDLSDPMVSSDDACSLFSICLSIFLETRAKCGRIVALDEAHKFLSQSGEAATLTNELTSIIRQQRHTSTRVLIATQEPTLSPELLDLANVTFVHRFLSPAWYEILKKHLAGADRQDHGSANSLFHQTVGLGTGEALLFCPTARIAAQTVTRGHRQATALGSGFMRLKIRKRMTADGGQSIMSTDSTNTVSAQTTPNEVPMHVVSAPKPKITSKVVKEDNNKMPTNTQAPAKGHSTSNVRKEGVIAEAQRLVTKKFQEKPHIWTRWGDVSQAQRKLLWDELEAGLGVPKGSVQNNRSYILTLSNAMDQHVVTLNKK